MVFSKSEVVLGEVTCCAGGAVSCMAQARTEPAHSREGLGPGTQRRTLRLRSLAASSPQASLQFRGGLALGGFCCVCFA